MSLTLSPETERLLRDAIARGGYASANEVVRKVLRLLAEETEPASDEGGPLFGSMSEHADDLDLTVEQAMEARGHPPRRAADAG